MIGAKEVTAPDGTTWQVGRQWLPTKPTLWRPKKREKKKLVLGLEVLIVLVLLIGGLGARLVLRKPWAVRARASDGHELTWSAPGFRA